MAQSALWSSGNPTQRTKRLRSVSARRAAAQRARADEVARVSDALLGRKNVLDKRWLGDLDAYTMAGEPASRDAVVDSVERLLDKFYDNGPGNLHFDIRVYEVDRQRAAHRDEPTFRTSSGRVG